MLGEILDILKFLNLLKWDGDRLTLPVAYSIWAKLISLAISFIYLSIFFLYCWSAHVSKTIITHLWGINDRPDLLVSCPMGLAIQAFCQLWIYICFISMCKPINVAQTANIALSQVQPRTCHFPWEKNTTAQNEQHYYTYKSSGNPLLRVQRWSETNTNIH